MTSDEQSLKGLHREQTSEQDRSQCPAPDLLVDASQQRLDPERRGELLQHLATCSDCAEEFQLLTPLKDLVEKHIDAPATPKVIWWNRLSQRRLRLAASLVLMLLSAGLFWMTRQAGQIPGGSSDQVRGRRTSALEIHPENRQTMQRPVRELSWKSEKGADGYRIQLFDAASSPLWESGLLSESRVELPAKVQLQLKSGTYYWRVITITGMSRRQSDLHQFTVK